MSKRYKRSYDEAVYGRLRGEPHYLFSTYAHYATYFDNTDLSLNKWMKFFADSLRAQVRQEQDIVRAFDPTMSVPKFTQVIIDRINDKDNFLFELLTGDIAAICEKLFEGQIKDRVALTTEQLEILLWEIERTVNYAADRIVDDIDNDRNLFLNKRDAISKETMNKLKYMPLMQEIMQKKTKKGTPKSATRNALVNYARTARREQVGSYDIGRIGETLLAHLLSQIVDDYKDPNYKVTIVGGKTSLTGKGKAKADVTMGGKINFQMKAYRHYYMGDNYYANVTLHSANSIALLESYMSLYDTGANANAFWAYFLNTYSMYLNGIMFRDPGIDVNKNNKQDTANAKLKAGNWKTGGGFLRIQELNEILGMTLSIWMGSGFGLNGTGLGKGLNVQGAEEITRNDFFVIGNKLVSPASHIMSYLFKNKSAISVELGLSEITQDELILAYGKKLAAGPGMYNKGAIDAGVNAGKQFANTQVSIKANLALNRIANKKFKSTGGK